VTLCLILRWAFAVKLAHEDINPRSTLRRCHGNRFRNYICKWTLTGDNDMRLSYKGRLVFSQPPRLLVALSGFVVTAIVTAPGARLSYPVYIRYNRLSTGLTIGCTCRPKQTSNRLLNRSDVCLHDTAGCQTGCENGLTTVLNEQSLFVQHGRQTVLNNLSDNQL